MKKHLRQLVFCKLLILIFSINSFAQITEPSYDLEFLKARYIDSTNPKEVILIFKHSTKTKKEEKLIISGKLTYSLGSNQEKTEILGNAGNRHSIAVFGRDINLKEPYLYNLIKDNVELSDQSDFKFLVFYLRNLSDSYFDRMTFTYGLWEPLNQEVRIEKKYEVKVDR